MEILEEFDFDRRESRSQWAKYIDALVDGINGRPIHAIKIEVGRDIPASTGLDNAHTGLSTYARDRRGRSARVKKFPNASPPYLVVGLRPEGQSRRRKSPSRGVAVVNA